MGQDGERSPGASRRTEQGKVTREEAIASLDDSATKMVAAFLNLGLTCAVVHELDDDKDFRLICPQTLLVHPLLLQAANHLDKTEGEHKC